MLTIRAQIVLKTVDGVAENFVTNTLAFTGDFPAADAPEITPFIKTFYDGWLSYMSPAIAQLGHEVKYYNLPGTPPNYPFLIDEFALAAAPAGSKMPPEVALCLSFQGGKAAGFPQARRRGRIYLGPFDQTAIDGEGRPQEGLIDDIVEAAAAFKEDVEGLASDTLWSVWSSVDQEGVTVNNGWVDNSFDTQRRRGIDPTSRETFV